MTAALSPSRRRRYIGAMADSLVLNLSALLSLLPVAFVSWRRSGPPDAVYRALLAVAVAGPLVYVVAQLAGGWLTGLSTALWVSVAASMVLFAALVATRREAWRLTLLLAPYLLLVGVVASLVAYAPGRPLAANAPAAWVDIHIVLSVATYALLTLAAIAGLAVFLQERALKLKRPGGLSRALPSMADSEAMQVWLLTAAAVVLATGVATGMATQYLESGRLLLFDHKTLFSLAACAIIAILLVLHHRSGIGGRRGARLILLAYLSLTLAYPGVKFVTQVLMAP